MQLHITLSLLMLCITGQTSINYMLTNVDKKHRITAKFRGSIVDGNAKFQKNLILLKKKIKKLPYWNKAAETTFPTSLYNNEVQSILMQLCLIAVGSLHFHLILHQKLIEQPFSLTLNNNFLHTQLAFIVHLQQDF